MDQQQLYDLVDRYVQGSLDSEGKRELARLLEDPIMEDRFGQLVQEQLGSKWYEIEGALTDVYSRIETPVMKYVRTGGDRGIQHIGQRPYWGWVAAAVFILLLAGGAYLWKMRREKELPVAQTVIQNDAQPGKHGAVLTLSDGKQITLDSLHNGAVAAQAGANLLLQNGTLAYQATDRSKTAIAYNTMTTPGGRQFQLVLPDRTRVWLNAGSSIRYPTVFNGNERKVSITGEVYFEVAQDVKMPFFVVAPGDMAIQVLGTHFNINAYADEPSINTTLLEGSVKVVSGHSAMLLHPGQQAQEYNGGIRLIVKADVDQAVAWKNGFFSFTDVDLPALMRQLSRWYNVTVTYEGTIPKGRFNGEIDRSLTLDQLLKGLTNTIHYRIEDGNKIIILP